MHACMHAMEAICDCILCDIYREEGFKELLTMVHIFKNNPFPKTHQNKISASQPYPILPL